MFKIDISALPRLSGDPWEPVLIWWDDMGWPHLNPQPLRNPAIPVFTTGFVTSQVVGRISEASTVL